MEGRPLSASNVVIQFIGYRQSPADSRSPHAVTIGSGEAWVLTDGRLLMGTWNRPSISDRLELSMADGTPIELTPGVTWLELPRPGSASVED